MLWIPLDDLTYTKRDDVISTRSFWINRRINRNYRAYPSIEQGHCDILPKSSCCLIDISLDRQTVVETTVDIFDISSLIVISYMTNVDGSHVNAKTCENRGDN